MIEKRIYPRVEKKFSVTIQNEQGLKLNVLAVDASSVGVCVQCNVLERNLITPGGSFVSHGKPVELYIWLELPFNGKAEKVGARCHVSFSRRISNNQCEIGMRYMDLEENGYETLVRYISSVNAANEYIK